MFQKTIGILGGMGPVASADTYVELVKMCQQKYGCVQDSDFPAVVLYSLPLSKFDQRGFSDDSAERHAVVSQLLPALKKLEQFGAEVIIIDCNTVHYFFDELQSGIKTPIVNLIAVTVEQVKASHYTKVAVLCSQSSKDVGLYLKPLSKEGIAVLDTPQADQDMINDAILAVMGGSVTTTHIGNINAMIGRYTQGGAQCVILGCTEISNIAKQLTHETVLIDSEALAVAQAIDFAR